MFGVTVKSISLQGDTVKFFVPDVAAKYEGKLEANETRPTIVGTWSMATGLFSSHSRPLALQRLRGNEPPDFSRPQEPKKPYPYLEEEVTYPNAQAKIKLAGTLTKPKGEGPFPAVVIISGSGPQDRDGHVMYGHMPYWVLADYLTRQGIAVLRFDERGVGESTGKFFGATSADFLGDVLAGVEYLKTRKDIDRGKIGLVGHSEGGVIAPLAAARSKDVAYIVLLAGPALPGVRLAAIQDQRILRKMDYPEQAVAVMLMQTKYVAATLNEVPDDGRAEKPITQGLKIFNDELLKLGIGASEFPRETYAWQRFFLGHDPRPVLSRVTCPVLALFGENDLLVPAKENQAEMEKALRSGGNKDFTITVIPQANHLFQTSETGIPGEHVWIPETMNPKVMAMVSEWIRKKAGAE
jgi:pimeloyl-ACP methyl ester carboxylesterase